MFDGYRSGYKFFLGWVLFALLCTVAGCAMIKTNNALGSVPSVFVIGEGIGADKDSALNDAFRDAVQKGVGVLVRSQIVLDQGKITKDVVQEYSAGFISSYEVISQTRSINGMSKIKIGALISSTKLLSKLRPVSSGSAAGNIKSEKIYAQITTLSNSLEQGDALLMYALEGYPTRAIKVKLGDPRLVLDQNRDKALEVPYTISWSNDYLESLLEAIKFVSNDRCLVFGGFGSNCTYDVKVGEVWGYKLADKRQASILSAYIKPNIGVSVRLIGEGESLLGSYCMPFDANPGYGDYYYRNNVGKKLLEWRYGALNIYDTSITSSFKLDVLKAEDIKKLKRIDASITNSCN